MLVKNIYYGRRKVSLIYVNGKIVWRAGGSSMNPDYKYPVQNDTDLYIPQIYTAIQTGTNVDFTKSDIIAE